jgi:hypothetical protein
VTSVPNGRTPRPRRRKPGDLAALKRVLWEVLTRAEAITTDPAMPPDLMLRGAHAVASLAGVYLRAVEAADLVPRIEALEAELDTRTAPVP